MTLYTVADAFLRCLFITWTRDVRLLMSVYNGEIAGNASMTRWIRNLGCLTNWRVRAATSPIDAHHVRARDRDTPVFRAGAAERALAAVTGGFSG